MTIEKYLESAQKVEELAKEHLGQYVKYYSLKRLDCGNIEFELSWGVEDELLELLPDDTKDFPTYLQFCYCDGEWRRCMAQLITNVGAYKEYKRRKRDERTTKKD